MLEMWSILKGAGNDDDEKMKLVNLKRFICALEGIPTNKLLKKRVKHDADVY
jgi:hypothetical protein